MDEFELCKFLFERWKNLARWRNLWSILIYLLGVAVTLSLIATIFFFVRESLIPAALSTLGTIFNGVAVAWVLARRNQAVEEETQAKNELIEKCSPPKAAGVAEAKDAGPKGVAAAIAEVEKELSLFGAFR